jgi:hypothetical protein
MTGDGEECIAVLSQGVLVMSRPVAGLACRVRIPVRQYQAVALLEQGDTHVIRLIHRDAALAVDVEEFESLATAEEYCDRLAGFLGLPAVLLGGAPNEADEPRAAAPRRNPSTRTRRPRFLSRRRPGGKVSVRRIEGREIIARH